MRLLKPIMSSPTTDPVLLVADIEGSSGCWSYQASSFMTNAWREACVEMSLDINAVVSACADAGVTNIVVKDFHRTGYNLIPELIDKRARIVHGYHRGPVPGVGHPGEASRVLYIGLHAASGTNGFLAHTLTSRIARLEVNGRPLPEIALFSASLAPFNIRPIFFSGCPTACAQAAYIIPGIETYAIEKTGNFRNFEASAWRSGLAAAAVRSLSNQSTEPYRPQGPFRAAITMRDGEATAVKLARRWKISQKYNQLFINTEDIQALYHHLIRLCYLTPFIRRILPLGLFLFNLRGRYGLHWLRKGMSL